MLFSQVIVLALNTPKPKSMSALGMYCARVKWDVASVLLRTRYSLPQCTQNLIWACAQTDCSLPNLTIKVVPSLHLTFLGETRSWDCFPPTTSRVRTLMMRSLSDSHCMHSSMPQSHPEFMPRTCSRIFAFVKPRLDTWICKSRLCPRPCLLIVAFVKL